MRTATVPALLAVVCLVTAVTSQAQSYVIPDQDISGSGLLYTHLVEGGRVWDPRTIWSPVHVTLNCSAPGFSVLTASSVAELPEARKVLWCGWRSIMKEPNVCELRFSMLRNSCFAVKPQQAGFLSLGQPDLQCTVTTREDVFADIVRGAVTTALAVELFLNAHRLSRSQAFRLTSGGVMGVTLVALIACVFIFRTAPAKKYLAGSFVLSAGATWAFLKWCFSNSIPSMFQMLLTPVGVWYIIITATAGVSVTYWIDNPDHYKLHNTIRAGLQLAALFLVYTSIADPVLAIAAVLALICYGWLYGFFSAVKQVVSKVNKLVTWLISMVRKPAAPPAVQPKRRIVDPTELVELPEDYQEDEYEFSQDSDYSPDTSEDDEEEEDNSEVEEEEGPALSGGIATEPEDEGGQGGGWRSWQRAPAAAAAAGAPAAPKPQPSAGSFWSWRGWGRSAPAAAAPAAAGVATSAVEELAGAPSFDEWAQPRRTQTHAAQAAAQASLAGAGAAGDAGAGRAPGPSPGGWGAPLVAVDRAQGTNYQQQQQQPAEVQRPTSTSPWSEKKVVDFTQPKPFSSPAAPQAAAAAAGTSSTLKTASRKVENPETGREITINGSTFRELLARGYEYDAASNKLVLTAAGQASPAPAVNVRGAPTPSSNLRSRRSGAAV